MLICQCWCCWRALCSWAVSRCSAATLPGEGGRPAYNSINAGVVVALTVVLDLVLIPRYGVIGAALASSIAYTGQFLIAIICYLAISRSAREATPLQASVP
ncbi:hypothetical protein CLG94_12460 [Candidatus Methylomirabilis limnetica]|uniref:Uncharacterized protein n=1 Tax=Candidatus Methylomirabilis limnetica TaxID=2033718 RepID=A0A2T4TUW8_9BACT|nr:hypothetical protein CLG94_12460 [Candidatus Methylomirabilis limnetica]